MSYIFEKVLKEIMSDLKIPFLSEADFQHAFAWKLHEKYSEAELILEYPEKRDKRINHYDIYFRDEEQGTHLIELKYKTKKDEVYRLKKEKNINFELANQAANDIGCYSFWKDVERLETANIANAKYNYCIFLTNDPIYWKKNQNTKEVSYEEFKIYDTRKVLSSETREKQSAKITLNWKNQKDWMDKYPCLKLSGEYVCNWESYPVANQYSGKIWKYLLLEVRQKIFYLL